LHKVCWGASVPGGNDSAPEAGPAIMVSEDMLFWPLPEGKYGLRLDVMMPKNEDGSDGKRIACFEGWAMLHY